MVQAEPLTTCASSIHSRAGATCRLATGADPSPGPRDLTLLLETEASVGSRLAMRFLFHDGAIKLSERLAHCAVVVPVVG